MKPGEKPLFVFELANNHMGDAGHGCKIIDEIAAITKEFSFDFAFKLQYRQLDTFIHPDFHERKDIKYIKRFVETRLDPGDFRNIKDHIKAKGFLAVCTPFDEASVDMVEEHDFDFLKIASCSFTDWPLLERISQTRLPLIASTAGVELFNIDRVVSFFEHRDKSLALMHCIAEYPTPAKNSNLNQIDLFRKRYPDHTIGYSTHESPDELTSIKLAVAKGARIFEKHVGLETGQYKLNAYSANPEQVYKWLKAAGEAFEYCGEQDERHAFSQKETDDLRGLRRGVFARHDLKKGEKIETEDVFFAIPVGEGQITANDFSKYTEFRLLKDIRKNEAVLFADTEKTELREKVLAITRDVSKFIIESRMAVPDKVDFEISHHYGIDKYYEVGTTIINFINREYCKKLIILLPGQTHPEQYHKQKEETFHIMYGTLELTLDGVARLFKSGDIIVIERGVKHKMFTQAGVIIEEISSTHYKDDSYYTDETITRNKNRKTEITLWLKSIK
ncbi:MAG TPA: N-acetylneuraminate synthase family protein [Bacteroidales bacterium]|nr:N-acetylneuraminate synthase family protein [Bacteroidales bacterium]